MMLSCFLCNQLAFINWLQNHLLPCPFKYLTGIDCPGCGLQRSIIALLQGNFHKSFLLYPATVPLVVLFSFMAADKYFKLDGSKKIVKTTLYVITVSVLIVSYGVKLWSVYGSHNAAV